MSGLLDDAIFFVIGLTELSVPRLVAIAVVGRAQGFPFVASAGAELNNQPLVGVTLLPAFALVNSLLSLHATVAQRASGSTNPIKKSWPASGSTEAAARELSPVVERPVAQTGRNERGGDEVR